MLLSLEAEPLVRDANNDQRDESRSLTSGLLSGDMGQMLIEACKYRCLILPLYLKRKIVVILALR